MSALGSMQSPLDSVAAIVESRHNHPHIRRQIFSGGGGSGLPCSVDIPEVLGGTAKRRCSLDPKFPPRAGK